MKRYRSIKQKKSPQMFGVRHSTTGFGRDPSPIRPRGQPAERGPHVRRSTAAGITRRIHADSKRRIHGQNAPDDDGNLSTTPKQFAQRIRQFPRPGSPANGQRRRSARDWFSV